MKIRVLFAFLLTMSCFAYAQNDKLIILHTNDMHSQVEPISEKIGGFKSGKGGMVRLYSYIHYIKSTNPNVLLLDAGDFSQGSSYYNLFKGNTEIDMMNLVHYDAGTMGNHEFDLGMDNLAKLFEKANFPIINCNYDLSNTPLKNLVKDYVIVYKAGLKIGVFGLGTPDLYGLTFKKNIKNLVIKDTYNSANGIADKLKNEEKCDLVICLSHLGWNDTPVCDSLLATKSKYIDVIVGGHSHTYMKTAKHVKNVVGNDVIVNQTSGNTASVGRIEIDLKKKE